MTHYLEKYFIFSRLYIKYKDIASFYISRWTRNKFMDQNEKKFKVKVLRDICIGAGPCEAVSPQVFKIDEENKAIVLDQGVKPDQGGFIEITKDTLENVLDAAKSCPVFAIVVIDETGKQIYPEQ